MENKNALLAQLNQFSRGNLLETLGIQFTDVSPESLTAELNVTPKVHQPNGILHGGTSSVLAETIGSMLSAMHILESGKTVVGTQITSNHLKPVKSGKIIGKGTFIKKGKSTHLLQIDIKDEQGNLISHNILKTMVVDTSKGTGENK